MNLVGTVRGRLGFLFNSATVAYFTGGFAYGQTELNVNNNLVGVVAAGGRKQTRGGNTLGGGFETKLWGNWTAKAEYLYVDLGNQTVSLPGGGFAQVLSVESFTHVVRAGLNQRFLVSISPLCSRD